MPTTTIRLPEDLKGRLARAAEHAGMSSHAYILAAIEERVGAEERRNDFYDTAVQRYAEILTSGKAVPWSEMRAHLEARLAGKKSIRPAARKLTW